MSEASDRRSTEFLAIADQFKLGALVTEGSHPITANLSQVAGADIAQGLKLLFQADADVLERFGSFVQSGRAVSIADTVVGALRHGGRVFFTGCGSTGRLSIQLAAIWRDAWQRFAGREVPADRAADLEQRALPVMAGGDFALIKSVEGFEDFATFGRQQMRDLTVGPRDVVFAITEGGETSFVIGTAWEGVDAGAKVYFVYNNPDAALCEQVQRSREVIQDPRIEKLNLTTGPMAISGSTRMQATTIQLCVMATVLEMVVRSLLDWPEAAAKQRAEVDAVPAAFLRYLGEAFATLQTPAVLESLAALVSLEESVYRSGRRNNYFADALGIDVLTDTTERSPTYCTPPFRKFDDPGASESWSFLFVPAPDAGSAWRHILKRSPRCIAWSAEQAGRLVASDKLDRTCEILARITEPELMRFRIGLDGLSIRAPRSGDRAVGIVTERDLVQLTDRAGFVHQQVATAAAAGARTGLLMFGGVGGCSRVREFLTGWEVKPVAVLVPVPTTGFILDGVTRVAVKCLLNALSTCTMVRLGRVMGNTMIWVVPSNLKLIDRATRYIVRLTGLDYAPANRLLFEVVEYVEPRMKTDRAYPPVVGMAVLRHREGLTNQQAEVRLLGPTTS